VVRRGLYIPKGCPAHPESDQGWFAALLSGQIPRKGAVLAARHRALEECSAKASQTIRIAFTEFKRPTRSCSIPPNASSPRDGLLGPATRAAAARNGRGQHAVPPAASPHSSRCADQGAKILSSSGHIGGEAKRASPGARRQPGSRREFYRYGPPRVAAAKVNLSATSTIPSDKFQGRQTSLVANIGRLILASGLRLPNFRFQSFSPSAFQLSAFSPSAFHPSVFAFPPFRFSAFPPHGHATKTSLQPRHLRANRRTQAAKTQRYDRPDHPLEGPGQDRHLSRRQGGR